MDWLGKFVQALVGQVQQPQRQQQQLRRPVQNVRPVRRPPLVYSANKSPLVNDTRFAFPGNTTERGSTGRPETTFLDLYNEMRPGGGLGNVRNPYMLDRQDRPMPRVGQRDFKQRSRLNESIGMPYGDYTLPYWPMEY